MKKIFTAVYKSLIGRRKNENSTSHDPTMQGWDKSDQADTGCACLCLLLLSVPVKLLGVSK